MLNLAENQLEVKRGRTNIHLMANKQALFESLILSPASSPVPTKIPPFLYGCAWKKEQTDNLVFQALQAGFRGLDVAAQPRHYREDLAGQGLRRALASGKVKRGDLFIQTKYSPPGAQDPGNCPYEPSVSTTKQVEASIRSSLHNLRVAEDPHGSDSETTYIDCLVLHSPLPDYKLTLEAWRAFEAHVPNTIKHLGISNTTLPTLQGLYKDARIKPIVVQQRFHRDSLYEVALRKWCRRRGIIFQSFWTLTGNPRLLHSSPVRDLAHHARVSPEMALYTYVLGLEGTVICNGTTTHMKEDLDGLEKVRAWASSNESAWANLLKHFKDLIGENQDEPIDVAVSATGVKPQAAEKTRGL